MDGNSYVIKKSAKKTVKIDSHMMMITMPTRPDQGYAYVILLCSFIGHFIIYGISYSMGVFYVVFREMFRDVQGSVALLAALNMACVFIAGSGMITSTDVYQSLVFVSAPVSSILTNRFGPQAVCISGGILSALAFFLSVFTSNLYVLYLTFGVMTGVGLGLSFIPVLTILGSYFVKRRTLAVGFAVSGSGLGNLALSPLIQYLLDIYGWKGSCLILSGLSLNLCVIGMLLKPIIVDGNIKTISEKLGDDLSEEQVTGNLFEETPNENTQPFLLHSAENKIWGNESPNVYTKRIVNQNVSRQISEESTDLLPIRSMETHSKCDKLQNSLKQFLNDNGPEQNGITSFKSVHGLDTDSVCSTSPDICTNGEIFQEASCLKISSLQSVNSLDKTQSLEAFEIVHDNRIENPKWAINALNLFIFTNPSFLLLCLSNLCIYVGVAMVFTHLPAYAVTLGFTPYQGSLLLAFVGIGNFCGRILSGLLVTIPCVTEICVFVCEFFLCGILVAAYTLMADLVWLACLSVIFGVIYGSMCAVLPQITINILDLSLLVSGYGYLSLFAGIGNLLGSPIAGILSCCLIEVGCTLPHSTSLAPCCLCLLF